MARRPPETTPQRQTKAERKEQARKERLELVRKQAVRKRRRKLGTILGIVVVVAAVAVGVVLATTGGNGSKPTTPGELPGILTTKATSGAPWPANEALALDRANKVGLPAVGGEQHLHSLLQVFIHDQNIPVPADIGLSTSGTAAMHTHDATGIMHMESATPFDFTLGDFFDVWGVKFTSSCIGGYCTSGANELRVYVNGKLYKGDPTKMKLGQHMDVVVTFGTTSELPTPIPATYSVNISQSCKGSC